MQLDEADAETRSQSTGELLLYPLVEDGSAEAPDLADLQGANLPSPCQLLERLGMDLHDRCRLDLSRAVALGKMRPSEMPATEPSKAQHQLAAADWVFSGMPRTVNLSLPGKASYRSFRAPMLGN